MSIFLVDSNEQSRCRSLELLSHLEAAVNVAATGAELLQFLDQDKDWPTLVVIADNVTDVDCIELAKEVRSRADERYVIINFVIEQHCESNCLDRFLSVGDDIFLRSQYPDLLKARLAAQNRLIKRFVNTNKDLNSYEEYRQNIILEQDIVEKIFDTHCARHLIEQGNIFTNVSAKAMLNGEILITQTGPTGSIYIVIGDVSGRGLPAALGGLPTFTTFRTMAKKGLPVGKIAAEMNRNLLTMLPDNMLMAVCIVELSCHRDRLTVWSGGMPPGLIVSRTGEFREKIVPKHAPLTVVSEIDFSQDVNVYSLKSGDRVYLYTDSLDQTNIDGGISFTENDLLDVIKSDIGTAFSRMCQVIAQRSDNTDSVFVELVCDDTGSELESEQRDKQAVALPWSLDIYLTAKELRSLNPTPQIIRLLSNAIGLDVHQDFLSTIISELYSNALEHGVLGLDSQLKKTDEGFLEYYSARAERLEMLTDGWIRIKIAFVDGNVDILIHDSGAGFNTDESKDVDESESFGRGLDIIRSLCTRLEYSYGGSCVQVSYPVV